MLAAAFMRLALIVQIRRSASSSPQVALRTSLVRVAVKIRNSKARALVSCRSASAATKPATSA
jgi:hypothetical protein